MKLVKYRLMTFEKQFCHRCTRIAFCVLVERSFYCKECFEAMTHDPETRVQMAKIMNRLPDIE